MPAGWWLGGNLDQRRFRAWELGLVWFGVWFGSEFGVWVVEGKTHPSTRFRDLRMTPGSKPFQVNLIRRGCFAGRQNEHRTCPDLGEFVLGFAGGEGLIVLVEVSVLGFFWTCRAFEGIALGPNRQSPPHNFAFEQIM